MFTLSVIALFLYLTSLFAAAGVWYKKYAARRFIARQQQHNIRYNILQTRIADNHAIFSYNSLHHDLLGDRRSDKYNQLMSEYLNYSDNACNIASLIYLMTKDREKRDLLYKYLMDNYSAINTTFENVKKLKRFEIYEVISYFWKDFCNGLLYNQKYIYCTKTECIREDIQELFTEFRRHIVKCN